MRAAARGPSAGSDPRTACTGWCASLRSTPTHTGGTPRSRRSSSSPSWITSSTWRSTGTRTMREGDRFHAERRRRTARQQDGVRDPADALADEPRRAVPVRAFAVGEQADGHARPQGAARRDAPRRSARPTMAKERGGAAEHRLRRRIDPQLCPPSVPTRQGQPHRPRDRERPERPRREPRSVHPRVPARRRLPGKSSETVR